LPSNASTDELISIKPMQTFFDRLNQRLRSLKPRRNTSPTIAIVGGGVASIEVALCLSDWLERRQHKTELTIFTDREEAAADLGWIGRKRLHKLLLGRGVKMRTCQRVLNVTDGIIETEDATRHAADVVIWMTQASPPPLIATLGLPQDKRGFVATKPTLQSTGDERIFAAGDCGTIIPMPTAKAGVYAVRQTPVLTHNIAAVLSGRPTVTFKPQKRFLKLINTGDGKAMLVYEPIAIHARWCRYLKQHIDTRFMRQFGAAVGKESSTNVIS
ncbi:MAG: FAD-dependent oxidoreductase, partial [Planctomycetota bacterium]